VSVHARELGRVAQLRERVGKPKRVLVKKTIDPSLVAAIEGALTEPLLAAVRHKGKIESYKLTADTG